MTYGEYLGAWSAVTKGLYRFNGNANDSSWNTNTLTPTWTPTYVDWVFWQGINFNGTSQYVRRSDILWFNINWNNNITISCWFNLSVLPTAGNSMCLFMMAMDPVSWTRYFYRYNIINNAGVYSINSASRATFTFTPVVWTWYNFVFTTNTSQNNIIYLNWVSVASNTANDSAGAINNPNFSVWVTWFGSPFDYLNWKMDEVIVDNRVRTPQEVQKYYTMAKGRFGIT